MGDKYIAVVCTLNEGTGVWIQKLHLLDQTGLKEQTYKNPIDIIKSNVNFNIKSPYVTINIKNNTWKTKVTAKELKTLFKAVEYDSTLLYDENINDDSFTASVPLQISEYSFIGDIIITYKWDKKTSKFIASKINYNFNDI